MFERWTKQNTLTSLGLECWLSGSSLESREVENLGQVKSDSVADCSLPLCFFVVVEMISVDRKRIDEEMGPANSLQASAYVIQQI